MIEINKNNFSLGDYDWRIKIAKTADKMSDYIFVLDAEDMKYDYYYDIDL